MKKTLIGIGILVLIALVIFCYFLIAGDDESRKRHFSDIEDKSNDSKDDES